MGLNAKKAPKSGGGNTNRQPPIEIGTYDCRLVQLIDLGIQPQKPYRGNPKPPVHMIMMTYEFLDEFCIDEDGNEMEDKPRWLSEIIPFLNLECDLAKSTKRYHALDPSGEADGDFPLLLANCCHVTVSHNPREGEPDNPYQNIASVTAMRSKAAAKAADLVNDAKVFLIDEPDLDVFRSLPEWVQDKIKAGLEFAGSALDMALQSEGTEDEQESKKGHDRGQVAGNDKAASKKVSGKGKKSEADVVDDEGEAEPASPDLSEQVDDEEDGEW